MVRGNIVKERTKRCPDKKTWRVLFSKNVKEEAYSLNTDYTGSCGCYQETQALVKEVEKGN